MRLVSLVASINAPLLLGLAAVAPWMVPSVLGAKWIPAIVLIQILSVVSLLRSIINPIGSLQLAKGRADLGFWWNASLLVLSVPFVLVGGKLGQAVGIGYSLLILQIGLTLAGYFFLLRPLLGPCALEYTTSVMGPISMAGVMAAVVLAFAAVPVSMPTLALVAIQILLGLLIYLSLLRTFQNHIILEFRSALFSH
jgi:O-antigen/teichoic acid export membrane protein